MKVDNIYECVACGGLTLKDKQSQLKGFMLYGYTLSELKKIIDFAIERGFDPKNPTQSE